MIKSILSAAAIAAISLPLNAAPLSEAAIKQAAEAELRPEANRSRNAFRHPAETLAFFGLEDDMTVIEIAPGGMWYTDILAPLLKGKGHFIAAGYDPELKGQPGYRYKQIETLEQRFAKEPHFKGASIARFSPPESMQLAKANSVDMVLTFRNSHGWIRDGIAGKVYAKFFEVLKPGGVLGVVQHRGPSSSPGFSGYVTEAQLIKVAQEAGFVLDGFSEVNANPKDTKDHPKGVWTLPPVLRMGDTDKEKYLAIGESDRMTLRFKKPH